MSSSIADMTVSEWRRAWTEIAVAFETEPDDRTYEQNGLTTHGLCVAFRNWFEGVDSFQTCIWDTEICQMLERFHPCENEWFPCRGRYAGWRGFRPRYDAIRATFAALFAAMTPKEFLEICGGNHE